MRKVILLAFAAAFSKEAGSAESPAGLVLTPMQVNSNVGLYAGQYVLLKGYVVLTPNLHALYESKQLYAEFTRRIGTNNGTFNPRTYAPYCLTIANGELLEPYRHEVVGKEIILRGRFTTNHLAGEYIDMKSCPLPGAIMLDEADLKARFGVK